MRTAPPPRSFHPARDLGADIGDVPWLSRARGALLEQSSAAPLTEPLAAALHRTASELGRAASAAELLQHWSSRSPGHPRSETRYRWELCHRRGTPLPPYAPDPAEWTAWRPSEQARLERAPFDFETQLLAPMILTENGELLCEQSKDAGAEGDLARILLDEALPIFRRDFARHVQLAEPWEDTFALWCLTRRPQMLELLHPIAVAIASSYAADCGSAVRGERFPFHGTPLVSASAQLASSLLLIGMDLQTAAGLADFVRDSRRPSGAWGDGDEPEDVLTTLVCADLLATIDPGFDPGPTLEFIRERQHADGLWRALGPDAPWLTAEILRWATTAVRPFSERFRWPHRAPSVRDQKTGLPFFAHFVELAQLFGAFPTLAESSLQVGFIDLIGFRAFNNRYGQAAGDDVLSLFARELEALPLTRAIRDGGDEFLVLGAPCGGSLRSTLDTFRNSWPQVFRACFGDDVPPVAPRILLGEATGKTLRATREELGRGITALKDMVAEDPTTGFLVEADAVQSAAKQ